MQGHGNLQFRRAKTAVLLQNNLLDPGPLDQVLSLKPSTLSRFLLLIEAISEALLREIFLCGCVGVIFQVNSLLLYWLSKSHLPRFLSRNTAHSRFLFLVSCDQKQISDMFDLKAQSLAIKIVSFKSLHTADFLD